MSLGKGIAFAAVSAACVGICFTSVPGLVILVAFFGFGALTENGI